MRTGLYFCHRGHAFHPEAATLHPLSTEEAREWLLKHAAADTPFEPDATETRFTLRMPETLKRRMDAAAKEAGQSTNGWILRFLEVALK